VSYKKPDPDPYTLLQKGLESEQDPDPYIVYTDPKHC